MLLRLLILSWLASRLISPLVWHLTLWMPESMSSGQTDREQFCQIRPTMRRTIRRRRIFLQNGARLRKICWPNLILLRRKLRIFWIKSWSWMLFLLSMFCLVKKALSMLSSIILISGKISKPWCQSCLWRIFSPS